jgi:hypothetical protein
VAVGTLLSWLRVWETRHRLSKNGKVQLGKYFWHSACGSWLDIIGSFSVTRPLRCTMLAYRRQHQAIPVTHAMKGTAFAKAPYRMLHRCFLSGGRRTSALMRSVKFGAYRLRRGYWSARGPGTPPDPEPRGPQFSPPGTPLIRTSTPFCSPPRLIVIINRTIDKCLEKYADDVVSHSRRRRCSLARRASVPAKEVTRFKRGQRG